VAVGDWNDRALTWRCVQVEGLLDRSNAAAAGDEPGPDTELEHWRQQMSRFNSLTEQLKSHECRLVLGVTSMTHSPVSDGCMCTRAAATGMPDSKEAGS